MPGRSAEGTQRRVRRCLLVLSPLWPPAFKGARQDPGAWPALRSEQLSVPTFYTECRSSCPACCGAGRNRPYMKPRVWAERGGSRQCGHCLGLHPFKNFLYPSHCQPVLGLFGAGWGLVNEGQPCPDGGLALYIGAESSGRKWGVNPGQCRKQFCALCCQSSL